MEDMLAAYDRGRHRDAALQLLGMDIETTVLAWLSWSQAVLGYADKARALGLQAIEIATQGGHPFSIAQALQITSFGSFLLGDRQTVLDRTAKNTEYSGAQNIPFWLNVSLPLLGHAHVAMGQSAGGFEEISESLEFGKATGSDYISSLAEMCLAKAHFVMGDLDGANEVIAGVVPYIERNNGKDYFLQASCIQAEVDIARHGAQASEAERLLLETIRIAKECQYRMNELQASRTLARLWQSQGKTHEARDLLAPVYDWFTEGFDTPDLIAAKALLDELK